MDFLKRILPGNKEIDRVDLSEAEDKERQARHQVAVITQRTRELERRFFIDQVFPQKPRTERVNNGA